MKLKILPIALILAALLAGVLLATWYANSPQYAADETRSPNTVPFPERTTIPIRDSEVEMPPNSTGTPPVGTGTILSEEQMTALLEHAVNLHDENRYILVETDQYTIYVTRHAQFFDIMLKKIPLEEGIESAEVYLARELGMSREELCILKVDVFAPAQFDPERSQDLGLSKCPGPRSPENF